MKLPITSAATIIEAERFRLFISSVTDYAIYMLSPEGIVRTWNAGAQRFKGYTHDEIVGQHFSRFYTEEDRAAQRPATALATALASGKFEDEGWRVRKDGTRFWASVVIDPVHDGGGELLGFTKITRDVTERRKAHEALHASEERFRLLVQGVTDYAIYMLSPEGLVTNWNHGARHIKGYTAEEVIGTHFSRFYTGQDRQAGAPARALAAATREGRFETEGWRVRKDGSQFWAHVVIDPIRDPLGKLIGYAKVTRDVTERRNAEETLARTREVLLQSQKMEAIGKLTGGVAHDFNNLLNVIVNGLDVLRVTHDRNGQLKTIDSMQRAAERGAALTQQLLAFARQQPLKPERVNLNRAINSFEAVLRRALPSSVTLELNLAAALPDTVADTAQFEAALLNLVLNSRDAVGAGGVITLNTGVPDRQAEHLPGLPAGRYVAVRVADTGSGMPPEIVARAVEPFFTTKEVGKGTGLGLSQVYGMVQQAKGEMGIVSQPGQGTTITLYFPAAEETGNQASGEDAAEKVLVVDDQPDVLDMAVHLFQSLGYEVLSANNGAEALETLRRRPDIRILFSDVVMPGLSGIELARRAREHCPDLKILLASGYMASALRDHGGDIGEWDLITKPYRLSDIIRKLKAMH